MVPAMAANVTSWEDLVFFHEEVNGETGEFEYSTFALVDEYDVAYFGRTNHPRHNVTLEQLTSAIFPIPDDTIFPDWALHREKLTLAQDTILHVYIKRPNLPLYDVFKEHSVLELIPQGLVEEARVMEVLAQHPHPNIVHYHGCRVRRGRITGLVLDRHPNTLNDYLRNKVGTVDKEPFMKAIELAIHHLHSLDFAHDDINPGNILIDVEGMPILIDFGSARLIGGKLGTSRGTKRWIAGDLKDYHTSDKEHDFFALEKIRNWLDEPMQSKPSYLS
ncbi:serine/threonine-protein kinase [Diaporthe helianthi]|uniref:Serine/threonine-protein kinase n=1 Tax=Diaporthe helianthi TaxID=158607 RepID=A0A2P5HVD8_DIAHE|nr:serine/threonine-protein kinase [Diaporthe helianthi]